MFYLQNNIGKKLAVTQKKKKLSLKKMKQLEKYILLQPNYNH